MSDFIHIMKFCFNKAIFFVLITAMLAMQWSSAHIHLAAHHNHDDSYHQHNVDAHSHQSIFQTESSVNFAQQIDEHITNVVEIDNDCNIHNWNNLDDQVIALSSTHFRLNFFPFPSNIKPSGFGYSKRRYLDYSTTLLRAPPQYA